MEAALQRDEEEHRARVIGAWQTAALVRRALDGKLPNLQRLLARLSAPDQAGQLGMLSEHLGIPIRPISPEAKAALARLRAA